MMMTETETELPTKSFYMEWAITHPDETVTFYATLSIDEHARSRDAERESYAMAVDAHPDAVKIDHYMTRGGVNLSPTRAARIEREMLNGTWEGWEFA